MNFSWKSLPFGIFIGLCVLVPSCMNTKKAIYFNNIQDTVLIGAVSAKEPEIQKSDLLSITVSSLNPEASSLFNAPNLMMASTASTSASSNSSLSASGMGITSNGPTQVLGYLVNKDGMIKFPVLGDIKAAGLTKNQLGDLIAGDLSDKKLLVDPIVNVRFLNFRVTVLGEVARPTNINVTNEKISILEALGLAGDLTIYAKRDNVLLIREEGNEKIVRRLDLNSDKILTSPYFYLKTNDVVYVEPNKSKISSTNRALQILPIILSGLSFIAIILSYYIK
jgi:polysaccharide biosynthesis/export protein